MTEAGTTPVVQISGVDKVFGTRDKGSTVALSGIDLEIGKGEFVSLIGPSGGSRGSRVIALTRAT